MGVTIRDVAKHAGVSVATVSRCLNNSPHISEKTLEKVKESMEALNYQPSFLASNMLNQSSSTVGFVIDSSHQEIFGNNYFLVIQYGAEQALGNQGYHMLITDIAGNARGEAAIKKLVLGRRVDGLILPVSLARKNILDFLNRERFPYVIFGRPTDKAASCWLDLDNEMGGRIATEHMIARGARRLGFIATTFEKVFVKERYSGFCAALEQAGLAPGPVIEDVYTSGQGEDLAARLCAEEDLCDAYLVSDNIVAFGFLQGLARSGVPVPDQLQLTSFDNYLVPELSTPPMSVVDIDVFKLGAQAASMLLSQLAAPGSFQQQCLVPVDLVLRSTTR